MKHGSLTVDMQDLASQIVDMMKMSPCHASKLRVGAQALLCSLCKNHKENFFTVLEVHENDFLLHSD